MKEFILFSSPTRRDLINSINAWMKSQSVNVISWDYETPDKNTPDDKFHMVIYFETVPKMEHTGFKTT